MTPDENPASPVNLASDPAGDGDERPRIKRVRVRRDTPKINPDLSGTQTVKGSHPADSYVRVVRSQGGDFERTGPGHLVATEEALSPEGTLGKGYTRVKRIVIGAPLSTDQAGHERLTKVKALAVLSSDALSSVAYATEEILRVLLLAAGLSALSVSLPIGAAIIALLVIVGVSYRQTIKAYPQGGGSYIVAKDNLGTGPALTAGAALLTDYVLTVAVSIAAAVAALVSAFPELHTHRVGVGVGFIVLVTVLNLRGIRESGSIFAVPTYLFLIGIFAMLGIGFVENMLDGFPVEEPPEAAAEFAGSGALGVFIVLKAFSSGCAALTGVEAISDGVPAFKHPEWKNARTTLTVMISILAVTFAGITFLAHQFGTYPMEAHEPNYETEVSQIARHTFGGANAPYFYIQFATMAILVLAANTAYSDFPRLAYFLARDKFMPRQFAFKGDRLAFSTGIITLGILSAVVLAVYQGDVEHLIPLYALGVFTSFTISQFAMFTRWQRRKEPGWQTGRIINLAGAAATAVVAVVVAITKFGSGAWLTAIVIGLLILLMRGIHIHYESASRELAATTPLKPEEILHTVVVPIARVNRIAVQTLAYAQSISDSVTAVHVSDGEEDAGEFTAAWNELGLPVQLVVIESPYRALTGPLLKYIDEIDRQRPDDTVTVVLPEFIARHWWEHVLHNQTALRLKAALLFKPGIVVTSVPYHLERSTGGK
ncbi:MAG: APC family permease [Chloroflexota bacterium]|nr:APC family permease [Chloroflexota bacterium]